MAEFVSSGLTVVVAALLVAAALHDATARTIPNVIPASLAAVGLVLRLQDGTAVASLAIAVALLAGLCGLWLRGFIGGGDAKLISAVALVLQPAGVPTFLLSMAIGGGMLALLYLALSFVVRRPRPGARRGLPARILKAEAWRMHRRGPLPYAVAIAGGALPLLV